MNWCHSEPGLNALLSDPVIRALMDADGVDARKLEAELSISAVNCASAVSGIALIPVADRPDHQNSLALAAASPGSCGNTFPWGLRWR